MLILAKRVSFQSLFTIAWKLRLIGRCDLSSILVVR